MLCRTRHFLANFAKLISIESVLKNMRPIFVFAICLVALTVSTGSAFAQSQIPLQDRVLGIYAQVAVHDSSGNLVAYLETLRVTIFDPAGFNKIIDDNMNMFQRSVINVQGHDVEILKVNDSIVHSSPTIVSQNLVSLKTADGPKVLVAADHDGYPVTDGDKVTTYWTIIRALS